MGCWNSLGSHWDTHQGLLSWLKWIYARELPASGTKIFAALVIYWAEHLDCGVISSSPTWRCSSANCCSWGCGCTSSPEQSICLVTTAKLCNSDWLPLGRTANGLGSHMSAIAACPCLWPAGWPGIWPEGIPHLIRNIWPEGHCKASHYCPCFPVSSENQIWADSNVSCADCNKCSTRRILELSHQVTASLTFPELITHMTTSFFVVSRDRYSVQAVVLSYVLDSSTIFWNIVLFLWGGKKNK